MTDINILEIGCGNGIHPVTKFTYILLVLLVSQTIFFVSIGRALLALQALLPYSNTFCVNKEGYTYVQAFSRAELALVAMHYSIPIICRTIAQNPLEHQNQSHHHNHHHHHHHQRNESGLYVHVILPKVNKSPGIQKAQFPYPRASMQLIISQHSLNEGF